MSDVQTYTVQQVLGVLGQPYGPMRDVVPYSVVFREFGDSPVKWGRKSQPQPGETVEGKIHLDPQFGPRFERVNQGFQPRQQQAAPTPQHGQPPQQDRSHAIQRQHSQSVAIEYLKAKVHAGAIGGAENFPSLEDVRRVIDWFERDIAHSVNTTPPAVSTPPAVPAQQPYATPPAPQYPQYTNRSDIPSPQPQEFVHPQPADTDKIPFLREEIDGYASIKAHASRW